MIVTETNGRPTGVLVDADGRITRWTCLARRGMLHAECEAVDFFLLDSDARLTRQGPAGIAEIWFVARGTGVLEDGTPVGPGGLVVVPPFTNRELTARSQLSLIAVSVLPDRIARRLPPRHPDMDRHGKEVTHDAS